MHSSPQSPLKFIFAKKTNIATSPYPTQRHKPQVLLIQAINKETFIKIPPKRIFLPLAFDKM